MRASEPGSSQRCRLQDALPAGPAILARLPLPIEKEFRVCTFGALLRGDAEIAAARSRRAPQKNCLSCGWLVAAASFFFGLRAWIIARAV